MFYCLQENGPTILSEKMFYIISNTTCKMAGPFRTNVTIYICSRGHMVTIAVAK